MMRSDHDAAWKEILDVYFKEFIEFCLPELYAIVDWRQPWCCLDQELQSLSPDSASGKRLIDKLFKMYRLDGKEQWILIHLEIQAVYDLGFPKRMLVYSYRIFDKYQMPVISCAVLSDHRPGWRPDCYRTDTGIASAALSINYLVIKILDFEQRVAELEASPNPFASVILSQLHVLKFRNKPNRIKCSAKYDLTKRLYAKGFTREHVLNLLRFIDGLIRLPELLELQYQHQVRLLEEESNVAYVTSFERFALARGREEGIALGKLDAQNKIAKNFLLEGISPSIISKATGLSVEEILLLEQNLEQTEFLQHH